MAAELPRMASNRKTAILVVQRPTLSDRQDGDMLRQPGVLQIKEPAS